MESKTHASFAGYIAIGRIIAMVAGFVMPIFLTRFLSKSDYGLYAQFYTVTNFTYGIFNFGIQTSLYYFCPATDISNRRLYINNTFVLLLFFAIVGFIFVITPLTSNLIIRDSELNNYLLIIGLYVFFTMPNNILAPLFVVRKDSLFAVLQPPAEVLFRVVLIILASIIFKTLEMIFIVAVFYQFVVFLFVVWYTYKDEPLRSIKQLFNVKLAKEQLSYSLPFGIAVLLKTILDRFDKILCINYLTAEDYATYTLAFFGIPGIMIIYSSLSQVNVMDMSKAFKKNNIDKVISLYKNFTTKTLSFSVPIILIVILFAKDIIVLLFSKKYIESVPFFQIYILSFIVAMFGGGTILRSINKTRYTLKSYIISTIICVPIIYFGVKHWGMWGALCGAMCGIIFPKLFNMYSEMHLLKCTFTEYLPWKNIAVIIAASILPIIPIVLLYNWVSLNIVVCVTLGVIYLVIVSILEIKYNVFIFSKSYLLVKGKSIIAQIRK